jgi:hypothetical protein
MFLGPACARHDVYDTASLLRLLLYLYFLVVIPSSAVCILGACLCASLALGWQSNSTFIPIFFGVSIILMFVFVFLMASISFLSFSWLGLASNNRAVSKADSIIRGAIAYFFQILVTYVVRRVYPREWAYYARLETNAKGIAIFVSQYNQIFTSRDSEAVDHRSLPQQTLRTSH